MGFYRAQKNRSARKFDEHVFFLPESFESHPSGPVAKSLNERFHPPPALLTKRHASDVMVNSYPKLSFVVSSH